MPRVSSIGRELIKVIPKFPALYVPNHELADDQSHQTLLWDTISSQLALPVDTLKEEWAKLKLLEKTNSRRSRKSTKPDLRSINDTVLQFYGTLLMEDSDEDSIDDTEADQGSTRTRSGRTSALSDGGSATSESGEPPRKRAYRKNTTTVSRSDRVLRSHVIGDKSRPPSSIRTSGNHPIRSFFDNVASTVANLPEDVQTIAKERISKIVSETEQEWLSKTAG